MRGQAHLEGFFTHGAGQGVELELQPAAVVGTHVHRQGLGHRAEAARLVGTVHPHLEGEGAGATVGAFHLADEERELARRGGQHVVVHERLPSGVSGRPGQRRLESTGAGRLLIDRRLLASTISTSCGCFCSALGVTDSTEPSTELGR